MRYRVLFLLILLLAALPGTGSAQSPALGAADRAMVRFDARPLFEVRGVSALPAIERSKLIHDRIRAAAEDPGFDPETITVTEADDGLAIGSPGRPLVTIYPADAQLEEVQPRVLAMVVRVRLVQAISDYRAGRTPEARRRAAWHAVFWTIAYAAAIAALVIASRAALAFTDRHVAARIAVWEERARNVVRLKAAWDGVRAALRIGFVAIGLFATYIWLNAVLLTLPWTREVGSAALALVSSPIRRLAVGIAAAIPQLVALAVVAALAVAALRITGRFFRLIAAGTLRLHNFEPEWAVPTQRLVRLVIILFAAVMAYPYVPGSSSEAFKAIGIFAGLVFSLGASSIVANMVAGQSLIYRRAFRVGDRVTITDVTGDVEEMTAQATYVRTPKNERVTIPNALVLASQVTNYSHFAKDRGLILHTVVGIGYEVSWQDVEAMLLEAARRTPGTLAEPPAFVLQTSLGDYSPTYELNVHIRDARAMPATYSALHACIQDVFAERGVQIMTPHYVGDPPEAKVPPKGNAGAGTT